MLCGIPKVFWVSISLQAELKILLKSADLQGWKFQEEKIKCIVRIWSLQV